MDPIIAPRCSMFNYGIARYSAIRSGESEKYFPFSFHDWKVPTPLGIVCLERKTFSNSEDLGLAAPHWLGLAMICGMWERGTSQLEIELKVLPGA